MAKSPGIISFSEDYLLSYAFVCPFLFLQIFSQFIFVTIGKPIYGFISVSIGGIMCIISSYILIAILEVGIKGAGMAMLVANIIPAVFYVQFFTRKKECILHFVRPKKHKHILLNTCINGLSEMVTNIAVACTVAVTNLILLDLVGESGIAASSANGQTQFLLNSLFIGFGAGLAPIFGFAHGSKNIAQTKKVFWLSAKFTMIGSVNIALICFFFSNDIIGLFLQKNSDTYTLAQTGFRLFMINFLFSGSNILTSAFFTSVSNGKLSACVSFLRTFVFIMSMLFILPKFIGIDGVWLAVPIAEFLALIVSITILIKVRKVYPY